MEKSEVLNSPSQRRLQFAGDSIWQSLPRPCCAECQRLVTQLLAEVVVSEPEQGGVHERED